MLTLLKEIDQDGDKMETETEIKIEIEIEIYTDTISFLEIGKLYSFSFLYIFPDSL